MALAVSTVFVRNIEKNRAPKANFQAVMEHEQQISASLDGRTVFGRSLARRVPQEQFSLFSNEDSAR